MLNEQRSLDVVCGAAARTAIETTTNLAASSSGGASRRAGRQVLYGLVLMMLSVAAVAEPVPVRVVTVAAGLNHPWSLAFLPGGDLLVTERNGGLRIIHDGKLETKSISGVPIAFAEGDGGLLGLTLHPEFARNGLLYVCLTVGSISANAASVIRGRLVGRTLQEVTTIFTAVPFKKAPDHFGCRLMFSPDQKLLVTLGDGRWYPYQAQALDNDLGKVVRLNDDGTIPADNPFARRWQARPEIYTYGHRNIQGIALNPLTGEVWIHEHGPKGGDEVNILHAGANYGWPMITYGIDYSGQVVSEKTAMPGMEQPVIYWTPSIAPSGMAFYTGARIPEWRGDLFVGALAGRYLRRVHFVGTLIVSQEVLLAELNERIREVCDGPDGYLYITTDATDGRILRLEPP
jgi:glucose/arabinose dehydrogenase